MSNADKYCKDYVNMFATLIETELSIKSKAIHIKPEPMKEICNESGEFTR